MNSESQVKFIHGLLLSGEKVRTHDMIFTHNITRTASRIADINRKFPNSVRCLDKKDWYKGKAVYVLNNENTKS